MSIRQDQALFDERSRDLAIEFLSDWNVIAESEVQASEKLERLHNELANEIQVAIEGWLQNAEMRGDIAEA